MVYAIFLKFVFENNFLDRQEREKYLENFGKILKKIYRRKWVINENNNQLFSAITSIKYES